jgi:hypothetical protein
MSDEELIARIENVRFTPVRIEVGYDMGDVDGLLGHLQAAARAGEPLRPIIDLVKLRTTKLREGYTIVEVDSFLESLAGPADAGSAGVPSGYVAGSVVQEQRGLLSRLFRR